MKVLAINEGALTDFEVYKLMQERKENRLHKSAMVAYAERNWMDHKVLKFLSHSHSKSSFLEQDNVQQFLQRIDEQNFELTAAEKLQFINHCPTELVDIHLIVEDCAGRFTEAQVEELIAIVEDTLALNFRKKDEDGDAEARHDAAGVKHEPEAEQEE
ncbi:TPA: hypothetical protein N0F65_010611 [Lagenidium giganteum]|uniref:DNA-directed RNA polymerase III subunit RPC9 n=1 Tax=Lagenidium giganteum TaxID=4803 RepID=A0AAV2Z949_9STRA|nr:TPA: hypothetical protein N0F65_010611 [Lagenidium giganteum]